MSPEQLRTAALIEGTLDAVVEPQGHGHPVIDRIVDSDIHDVPMARWPDLALAILEELGLDEAGRIDVQSAIDRHIKRLPCEACNEETQTGELEWQHYEMVLCSYCREAARQRRAEADEAEYWDQAADAARDES